MPHTAHAVSWKPASQPPDDDTTVLLATDDGEVWPGYRAAGQWYFCNDKPVRVAVSFWADLPPHPQH